MTDLLNEMLDLAGRHARRVLVGTEDELLPLFDLRDAAGQGYLVATPFLDANAKDAAARAVSELIKEKKIVRYVFMSEAWMIVRRKGIPYKPGISTPPSESADRIEIVAAIAVDKDGGFEARNWRIKRDGKTCVDLIPESQWEKMSPIRGGRFDNLFQPAPSPPPFLDVLNQ